MVFGGGGMTINKNRIPKYQIIADSGGTRIKFFCAASGAVVYTTEPVEIKNEDEEINIIWESEAKHLFNFCPKCSRWVSDVMYNADVCECVDCSPWENPPKYCFKCGKVIDNGDSFCKHCGIRVRYKEVWQ